MATLPNFTCSGRKDQARTARYLLTAFKENHMKDDPPYTGLWNGEATNLLLFPDDPSVPAEASPLANVPPTPASSLGPNSPLSLRQLIADWQRLLKRLGRRRRVLETILAAGQPIRLTNGILVVGFPPHRRFHRELLDMPDYRLCVEAELARMFLVRLSVVTAFYPESGGLHRKEPFGKTPA
jgi:hypothetical protein